MGHCWVPGNDLGTKMLQRTKRSTYSCGTWSPEVKMDMKLVIKRQHVRGHVVREVEWGPEAAEGRPVGK